MIHTVRGFGIVNKAELDAFLELSCFFDDPMDVGNLISGSSALSKSSLNIGNFSVHLLLKPHLKNFEHYFVSVWDKCNCAVVWTFFWHCLSLALEWRLTFSRPVATAEFSWHIECNTFTASSFMTWNSSTEIASPPLALFLVMLPKAHLTLDSRCLALGEWSHHRGYLCHEDLFLYRSIFHTQCQKSSYQKADTQY